ncbi:MAG: hypothetical protein J7578_21915, partial [Chitinophagaceae bacterium]|nr:hypothetical protein [Chitinophagaceae bacterium]
DMIQTIPAKDGLEYDWVMYPGSSAPYRVQISDSSKVRFFMKEEPGMYDLDLFVKDKTTNVGFYKKFYVKVTSVFNQGWLVMDEKNGHNDISIIQPNNTVERAIYSKSNNGEYLPAGWGKVCVYNRRTEQMIYFLSTNDGIQVNKANFVRSSRMKDWFFLDPGAIKPLDVFAQSTEEHFLTRDKAYGANLTVTPPYKYGFSTMGNYYLAPYQLSINIGSFIFYDTIAQRFWFRPVGNGDYALANISLPANTPQPWNLNNIGKRLLYAGMGPSSNFSAVFESNQRDSLFLLRGLLNGGSSVSQIVDTLPAGQLMQTASQYLASRSVQHIYFASDNKLYRWDLLAKTQTLVYTFPAGTEVRKMKWYYNNKSSTDPDNYNLMMVAAQEGAEGKVYMFPIALTGDITGGTYRNVFGGFGQIRDVTYKPAP